MLPRNILYYGLKDPPPEQVRLQAGPLSMLLSQGALRYIRLGDTEVLRGIEVAVHGDHWTTFPPAIADLVIVRAGRKFRASYSAESRAARWIVRITGSAGGRITFAMETRQDGVGLCVLHAARACAGRPCVIERTGGAVEQSRFPVLVSPQPPFSGLRALSYEVAPGLTAEVRFDGGTFETEDLRNWTGASYQTCGAGTRQYVRLSLRGAVPERAERTARSAVTFSFGERALPMPALGLGLAGRATARVQALHPAHLRVELDFGSPGWPAVLEHAAAEARSMGARLEAALLLTGDAEKELAALAELKPPAARWLLFDTRWVAPARRRLAGEFVAGVNSDFAELNRARPASLDLLDGVCFAIQPQTHATDHETLVENLAPQAAVLETARQFLGALPVFVTPVRLKPRDADPRQKSLFGAAWTVGSLKYLAQGVAGSATYYETSGARGVMEDERAVYPLYHVLADAGEFQGGEALVSESSDPLAVDGIVMRKRGRLRILLANFRPEPQNVRIATHALGTEVRLKQIDEINAESAMTAPEAFREAPGQALEITGHWLELPLAPLAVLRIDAG